MATGVIALSLSFSMFVHYDYFFFVIDFRVTCGMMTTYRNDSSVDGCVDVMVVLAYSALTGLSDYTWRFIEEETREKETTNKQT